MPVVYLSSSDSHFFNDEVDVLINDIESNMS